MITHGIADLLLLLNKKGGGRGGGVSVFICISPIHLYSINTQEKGNNWHGNSS